MKVVQRAFRWSFVLVLIPVVLGVCAWAGRTWWNLASAPPSKSTAPTGANETVKPESATVLIRIPQGTATQQIGRELEAKGLIRSTTAWDLRARWLQRQDPEGGFKAGTYQLSPTQPLSTIANTIWQGKVVQQNFTIPEGWSLRQMAAYFEEQGLFPATDFLAAAGQADRNQYPWLPANLPHLEGFLYPDTYSVNSSDRVTPQAVIQQMLNRFEQVALPLYQKGQNQTRLNLYQWVILASIVEEEAVVPMSDRALPECSHPGYVAGSLWGADPTVEYGLGIQQTVDQPLTLAEVKTPSPYNTYLNPGLPPTPIASAGIASLKAALYPENTPYLYFVARYDGTHVFSRTLSEHEAAQAAIRKQQSARQKRRGEGER